MEFAGLAGLAGNSAVSLIENGRTPVTGAALDAIASVLKCSPDFLRRPTPSPLMTQPLMRAYADAPQRLVDRQLADAALALELVETLELRTIPDRLPIFHGDLADEHTIEQFALDVRAAADLDEGAVVGNSIRTAERLGCVVLPMPDELGRHLGMSVRIDATPVLCLGKSSVDDGRQVPGDRQRFTVAHEIGHLSLHSHLGPPRTAQESALYEKQAHRFAGAFLAPGDAMLEELESLGGRVTLRTLASIKSRWGIAIKALVMRFRALDVIDADHARSLYKQISARGWNKDEPVPVGPETAVWLRLAMEKRFATGSDGLRLCAARAGIDVSHLHRWLDWGADSESAQVLALPKRATADNQTASDASVTLMMGRRPRPRPTSERLEG